MMSFRSIDEEIVEVINGLVDSISIIEEICFQNASTSSLIILQHNDPYIQINNFDLNSNPRFRQHYDSNPMLLFHKTTLPVIDGDDDDPFKPTADVTFSHLDPLSLILKSRKERETTRVNNEKNLSVIKLQALFRGYIHRTRIICGRGSSLELNTLESMTMTLNDKLSRMAQNIYRKEAFESLCFSDEEKFGQRVRPSKLNLSPTLLLSSSSDTQVNYQHTLPFTSFNELESHWKSIVRSCANLQNKSRFSACYMEKTTAHVPNSSSTPTSILIHSLFSWLQWRTNIIPKTNTVQSKSRAIRFKEPYNFVTTEAISTVNSSDLVKLGLDTTDIRQSVLSLNVEDISSLEFLKLVNCAKLKKLEVNVNKLRDLSGIYQASNLLELSASDNLITNIQPLHTMQYLQHLCLDSNKISSMDSMIYLSHLRTLSLCHNQIQYIPAMNCQCLTQVNISNNIISAIDSKCHFPNITSLDLSCNNLKCISGEWLSKSQILSNIVLSHNKMEKMIAPLYLPRCNTLWLSGNCIKDLDEWIIHGASVFLPFLTKLLLQNNQIGNLLPGTLSQLPSLEDLDLSFNKIENRNNLLGLITDGLDQLQRLYLHDNPVYEFAKKEDTLFQQKLKCSHRHQISNKLVNWIRVGCPHLTQISAYQFQCGYIDFLLSNPSCDFEGNTIIGEALKKLVKQRLMLNRNECGVHNIVSSHDLVVAIRVALISRESIHILNLADIINEFFSRQNYETLRYKTLLNTQTEQTKRNNSTPLKFINELVNWSCLERFSLFSNIQTTDDIQHFWIYDFKSDCVTRIQSLYRGWCVRKQRVLINLRDVMIRIQRDHANKNFDDVEVMRSSVVYGDHKRPERRGSCATLNTKLSACDMRTHYEVCRPEPSSTSVDITSKSSSASQDLQHVISTPVHSNLLASETTEEMAIFEGEVDVKSSKEKEVALSFGEWNITSSRLLQTLKRRKNKYNKLRKLKL